jgi:hypothetical protein
MTATAQGGQSSIASVAVVRAGAKGADADNRAVAHIIRVLTDSARS